VLTARVTTLFEKYPVVSETDIEVEFLPAKENPSSANPALKKVTRLSNAYHKTT
jgi:hypothetical protein